jgi:predicted dehydrogenase
MSDTVSTERARIGVIGVGQIGKYHLSNYSEIPQAEIVAVADINEAEAKRVAAQYNIPHVYTDFRKLLERDDLVAVDVCMHNNFHMPVTVAALEAGKNVLCEKPMAGAFVDAQKMYDTAQATGRRLGIQLANIFYKESKAAKALIDGGYLGKIYHARSTGHRRRGRPYVDGYGSINFVQKQIASGGALYDMGVYHITTMLYLLGNPGVVRISGKTYQETGMHSGRQERSGYNVEELGLGFVRLDGNLTLDIIEAWAIHLDAIEGSTIVGSEGGVRLNPFGYFHSAGDLDLVSTVDLDRFNYRLHAVQEQGDVYDSPQHHWVAVLQGRVPAIPTAELALNTMLISEGIYLSNQLGREVSTDEVRELSVSTAAKI